METSLLYETFFPISEMLMPYHNSREHLDDLFRLLDLCFTVIAVAKGYEGKDFPKELEMGSIRDLSVSVSDMGGILWNSRDSEEAPSITEEAREQILLAMMHIQDRLKRSVQNDFLPSFEVIRKKFSLNDSESFAFLLALAAEYDRKYESIFVYLHNNNTDMYATRWLAIRLYEILSGIPTPRTGMLSGDSPLLKYLCSRELKKRDRSETSERLVLSRRVTAYLFGQNEPDRMFRSFCTIPGEYRETEWLPVREDTDRQVRNIFLKKAFRDKGCFVLGLYGPKGIGRGYTAYRAVSSVGLRLLKIDLESLLRYHYSEAEKYWDMIYCETVLLGAIPCFVIDSPLVTSDENGRESRNTLAQQIREAAEAISRRFRFVFWLTREKDNSFADTNAEQLSFGFPMLTANERRMFWEKYLPRTGLDLMSCSNQYILTPQMIRQAAATAEDLSLARQIPVSDQIVSDAVRQHSTNQLGNMASLINAVFTWDDLVIGNEQKRQMQMICNQVRYRSIVNEDWGFRKKSPYGRGLCALFYGSPGTGKTMAVQVMANELGLDLYRIDLSQLTSKYIGETQKNISTLFEKAKNINAMLFFDEADSMFAKRSEVRDSNDRYANADTAFLLQKLEDFEGIAILATNYVNNIDDAFKRRIKFMINFVFPTAEVRLRLWKSILPPGARVDEPLDWEFFAERFELSGSNIKEILTNAAYLAASEGVGLKNKHLIEAVKLNFSKYGKILTSADFDYLGR